MVECFGSDIFQAHFRETTMQFEVFGNETELCPSFNRAKFTLTLLGKQHSPLQTE